MTEIERERTKGARERYGREGKVREIKRRRRILGEGDVKGEKKRGRYEQEEREKEDEEGREGKRGGRKRRRGRGRGKAMERERERGRRRLGRR